MLYTCSVIVSVAYRPFFAWCVVRSNEKVILDHYRYWFDCCSWPLREIGCLLQQKKKSSRRKQRKSSPANSHYTTSTVFILVLASVGIKTKAQSSYGFFVCCSAPFLQQFQRHFSRSTYQWVRVTIAVVRTHQMVTVKMISNVIGIIRTTRVMELKSSFSKNSAWSKITITKLEMWCGSRNFCDANCICRKAPRKRVLRNFSLPKRKGIYSINMMRQNNTLPYPYKIALKFK